MVLNWKGVHQDLALSASFYPKYTLIVNAPPSAMKVILRDEVNLKCSSPGSSKAFPVSASRVSLNLPFHAFQFAYLLLLGFTHFTSRTGNRSMRTNPASPKLPPTRGTKSVFLAGGVVAFGNGTRKSLTFSID